ncbi:RlmE family RNA methyltransferase [Marinihelvus fidelis]|uniref:Ribosomal RNA large subunit methyltransferase E n=1 Tax=Marinihelvus fidelis TaxID=2613842 RepID=A0A5N0TCS2_9GAMM|nr:RlmE family RNA methyltransferase [Marinihelvus fidelis]KAA9132478.1 RlmE family RNA methyltransferase [Marinihelvus fidelis]
MARSKSSRRWLNEHFDDPYVQQAQKEGWRGRAAYKLIELDDKYRLVKPGMRVADLGAAPGAWSQVVLKRIGAGGQLFALDILPMEPLEGAHIIEGDFTEDEPLQQLEALLDGRPIDLVLSDMAPNMSGMTAVDQPRAMYLAELALQFAVEWLKPGGDFLVKMFQGEGSDAFLADCRQAFDRVLVRKPKSSRPRSREVYVLGQGRRVQ